MTLQETKEKMVETVVGYLKTGIPRLSEKTKLAHRPLYGANSGEIYSVDPKGAVIVVETVIGLIGQEKDRSSFEETYSPEKFVKKYGLDKATQLAEILEKKLKSPSN